MVTKEWVAIHRKHHAKCETEDDPHSPQTRGIKTVLLQGSELYRTEAKNQETLAKFGHGTPDDWLERNLYTRFSWQGVGVMLIVDLFLFGAIGATVWAVQMLWIPITAAGIINGIGHWWGYRNFEAPDASTQRARRGASSSAARSCTTTTTPTRRRPSCRSSRYEFDIGWVYIRGLEMLGLAKVRKTPPQLKLGAIKPVADDKTLEAIIANRYEVMAKYARSLRRASRAEVAAPEGRGRDRRRSWPSCAWRAAGCTATTTRSRTRQGAGRRRIGVSP